MFNFLKRFLRESKSDNGFIEDVRLRGEIDLLLRDPQGQIKAHRHIKNTITAAGLTALAGLMVLDVGGTGFDYIAIGTDTPGATALGGECTTSGGERRGGANVTGTVVSVGTGTNNAAQFVTTFTFTGSLALTEEGIFNASSGGTMIASQSFAALNVANGDTLQITHKIQVS